MDINNKLEENIDDVLKIIEVEDAIAALYGCLPHKCSDQPLPAPLMLESKMGNTLQMPGQHNFKSSEENPQKGKPCKREANGSCDAFKAEAFSFGKSIELVTMNSTSLDANVGSETAYNASFSNNDIVGTPQRSQSNRSELQNSELIISPSKRARLEFSSMGSHAASVPISANADTLTVDHACEEVEDELFETDNSFETTIVEKKPDLEIMENFDAVSAYTEGEETSCDQKDQTIIAKKPEMQTGNSHTKSDNEASENDMAYKVKDNNKNFDIKIFKIPNREPSAERKKYCIIL